MKQCRYCNRTFKDKGEFCSMGCADKWVNEKASSDLTAQELMLKQGLYE